MTGRRTWWLLFATGLACLAGALGWATVMALRLEQRELEANAQTRHQENVRLALWRMDSWLGPQLAREAVRPYFEYLPFYAPQRAYTRILSEIEPGEIYTPSPLLTFESELFPLHFQINAFNQVSSPQIPGGEWRDLAQNDYLDSGAIQKHGPLLARVQALIGPGDVAGCVSAAESSMPWMKTEDLPPPPPVYVAAQSPQNDIDQRVQTLTKGNDLQQRAMNSNIAQQAEVAQQQAYLDEGNRRKNTQAGQMEPEIVVEVGPLVPIWMDCEPMSEESSSHHELMFIRRVRVGEEVVHQGMLGDWPRIRTALLEQVGDLFAAAELVPVTAPSEAAAESGTLLANIPASLAAGAPQVESIGLLTPVRTTLALTWLAVAGAAAAAGATLRASIAYGEKRTRFASAVTHELRTPLTTFRMYSEMLADDMIRDPAQRKAYLDTLRTESNRLASLVENVLSYARLEDGRSASHVQTTTVGALLDRMRGVLERRAADAGMALTIHNHAASDHAPSNDLADKTVAIDVEAVGQIVFNLVDNACKYAAGPDATDRRIELHAGLTDHRLEVTVQDHGRGVAPEHARAIFAPFERGGHGPGDTIPGVGLGLALSRDLARALGGDLTLESPCRQNDRDATPGACFRVIVPVQA